MNMWTWYASQWKKAHSNTERLTPEEAGNAMAFLVVHVLALLPLAAVVGALWGGR